MTPDEAKEIPDVVSGTCHALVLIDSGVQGSYVSSTFLHYLNRKIRQLERSFIVEIADESQREIVEIIEVCMIIVGGKEFPAKFMPMCLGGDAQIGCNIKMIKAQSPTGKFEYVHGDRKKCEMGIISIC
ncbi:hypothetical protein OSB04_028864 [Centaurea solstitialis]|uniref:Uncharacterized protein n=1 Tax=Centaurea solstitialis TaxID=347529 RepID=A0AA38SP10_9ASTR|nr:hypothetical protein OSB04_028864 [Centaurea solstitialis]